MFHGAAKYSMETLKCSDQGLCSSPNRPTMGRRAAGVGPWTPATAPGPGSSFISEPTHWHRVGLHQNPRRKPTTTSSIWV